MFDGKLINSYHLNTNNKSNFKAFEIVTCREISDYSGGTIIEEVKTAEEYLNADEQGLDDPFYRIFAVYKEPSSKTRKAIGDFYDIKEAMSFLYDLTGDRVNIYSL